MNPPENILPCVRDMPCVFKFWTPSKRGWTWVTAAIMHGVTTSRLGYSRGLLMASGLQCFLSDPFSTSSARSSFKCWSPHVFVKPTRPCSLPATSPTNSSLFAPVADASATWNHFRFSVNLVLSCLQAFIPVLFSGIAFPLHPTLHHIPQFLLVPQVST